MIPFYPEGNQGKFLRDTMEAQLGFILFMLFCIIALYELIKHLVESENSSKIIISIAILFSGSIVFAIERGNIILLSFIFTLLFIRLYDSKSKKIRYLSYFCLAVAAAIKIYPAFFGLLVLNKKRYKEAVDLFIIGLLIFILPFLFFNGSLDFRTMINGILISSSDNVYLGFGYNFSFFNLVRIIIGFSGKFLLDISSIFYIIPVVICFSIYFLSKEIWQKTLAIALFLIWIPAFSYTYTLIFLTIPMLLLLNVAARKVDYFYLILLALTQIPYFLPKIKCIDQLSENGFKFQLTWGMLIINLCILLIAIIVMIDVISSILRCRRSKRYN